MDALPGEDVTLFIDSCECCEKPEKPKDTFWVDRGGFWEITAAQRSETWYQSRRFRLTASKFGNAVGHVRHCREDDLADYICGIKERPLDDTSKFYIKRGEDYEPLAREWYTSKFHRTVTEVGMAVPKWNYFLGASPDGLVGDDGMVEFKVPEDVYTPLLNRVKTGPENESKVFVHIKPDHYDQMQGNMAIWARKWCDYVVFTPWKNRVYTERIPFNPTYWETLKPSLEAYVDVFIMPRFNQAGKKGLELPPTVSLEDALAGIRA